MEMARNVWPMFLAAIVAAAAAPASAQGTCELRINQRVLELGEAVPVQFVCTNTELPGQPEAEVPDGLVLRLSNATPSQFSQTSIINGRMSRQTTYTYSMQLTAVEEGTYTLGPVSALVDGTRLETEAVRIVVRKSAFNEGPNGDQRIFVELSVEPTSLYVTETYTATLVIGIRKVQIGGRTYDVDLLRQVLDLGGSQLSIFAGGSARQSEKTLTDSNGQSHRYAVFRVTKEMTADEVGTARVGPVFLRANYPTAVRRGVFGRLELSRTEKEIARAEAIEVTVKGPSQADRPDSFTGAIGRYLMDVTVKPTRIEQGQPVTLTISIRGKPLEGVAGPDLSSHPELTSRFDFSKDELVGDVDGGAKVFRRAIFPKQDGEQFVPPIEWSYFDIDREAYVSLTSKPIPITVERVAAQSETVTLLPIGPSLNEPPKLTVVAGGIAPNFVDPDIVLADSRFSLMTPVGISALTLPPVLCFAVVLTTRHRARLRGDAGYARRRRAVRHAELMIKTAMGTRDVARQWELLASALTKYLCDRFNLPATTLTPAETRDVLTSNGLESPLVDDIETFLEECDVLRFARGQVGDRSVRDAAGRLRAWIREIEGRR